LTAPVWRREHHRAGGAR